MKVCTYKFSGKPSLPSQSFPTKGWIYTAFCCCFFFFFKAFLLPFFCHKLLPDVTLKFTTKFKKLYAALACFFFFFFKTLLYMQVPSVSFPFPLQPLLAVAQKKTVVVLFYFFKSPPPPPHICEPTLKWAFWDCFG